MIRNAPIASLLISSSWRTPHSAACLLRAVHYSTTDGALLEPIQLHTRHSKQNEDPLAFRPLDPYVLSKRITHLCANGEVVKAIAMLKSSPQDAQNVVVWNNMIMQCMSMQKYRTAYGLFIDMKRRGISPNYATYAMMLNRLSKVPNWKLRPLQLEQAHKLYNTVSSYVESMQTDSTLPLKNTPVTAYLHILGNAGLYDKMLEVFHSLPKTGPLAATLHSYTVVFRSLMNRPARQDESSHERLTRNAADARFLWRNLVRAAGGPEKFSVDDRLIQTVIRVLSFGGSEDHALAFQIIRDFVGLDTALQPDTTSKDAINPPLKFPLSPELLQSLLELCNTARHYSLTTRWLQAVIERRVDVTGGPIPDRAHIQQGLLAHASLVATARLSSTTCNVHARQAVKLLEHLIQEHTLSGSKELEVKSGAFETAMATCMFAKDRATTNHVFKLMTGYDLIAFADGHTGQPRQELWPDRRSMNPGVIIMGYLARMAVQTSEPAFMRQCVRALLHFGGERLFSESKPGLIYQTYLPFYRLKMADTVLLLHKSKEKWVEGLDKQSRSRWNEMLSEAMSIRSKLETNPEDANSRARLPIPSIERLALYAQTSHQQALKNQHRKTRSRSSPSKRRREPKTVPLIKYL